MEFTGERFVPLKELLNDEIAFEHLHRYYACLELVNDKIVLDIACGEGYGTEILSKKAKKVIGIDIDNACIEHAKNNYKNSNIEFLQGSADNIPLGDGSVDIIISYETIEHLDESSQEKFLSEVKRILRKDGKLIISTPDKSNYSERYDQKNEFHLKEFNKDEFLSFLKNYFANVSCFLQGYEIVDIISAEKPELVKQLNVYDWPRSTQPFSRKYLIAACSDFHNESELSLSSVVLQVNKNYLEIMDRLVEKEAYIEELGAWGKSLDKEIAEKNTIIQKLHDPDSVAFLKELVQKQASAIAEFSLIEKRRELEIQRLELELIDKKNLEQQLIESEQRIRELNEFYTGAESKIEEKNIIVTQQSETISFLKRKLEEYSEKMLIFEGEKNDKDRIIEEQKNLYNRLYQQSDTVSQRLNEIYGSEGWKLLNKYYNLKGRLLPENSTRYKVLKKTVNTIRGKKDSRFLNSGSAKVLSPTNTAKQEKITTHFDPIDFPLFDQPFVSIIIPVYNGWEMTYKCLHSIKQNTQGTAYEIIVADDAATDETKNIKEYIRNIVVIRNEENMRFLRNCNNAAAQAKGKYILFLNNDTEVLPGWLYNLVDLMEKDETIGMTGSKFIYPDGRLQEAGGILWKDGSAWNFGNRQMPDAPEFNYIKEADYISGASLLIRSDLWKKIGGFDARFEPAYCEDSDLAFEVRKHGYKVVYQPLSEVIHHEGFSHGTDEHEGGIKEYQKLNNKKLIEKWKDVLQREHFPNGENVFWARDRSSKKKTLLVIDHYVPHYDKDAGSKTVFQYLKLFVSLNFNVKFIGDNFFRHEPYTTTLQQMGIEVLYGSWYANNWQQWIKDNQDKLDYVLLNRPHITIKYIDFIRNNTKAKILYYGHDLHFVREMKKYEVEKDPEILKLAEKWRETETYIFSNSDIVLAPSDAERETINKIMGHEKAKTILPYFFENITNPITDFSARKDILFVGGFTHQPNLDAVLWFVNEIFPHIKNEIPGIKFIIVGSNTPPEISKLASESVVVKGFLSDEKLEEIFSGIKLSVVPLRYGAGVKGKTVETLYKGVPLVSTNIGVEGLPGDCSFLDITDDAKEFAKRICILYQDHKRLVNLSEKSVEYIKNNFAEKVARDIVENIFKIK